MKVGWECGNLTSVRAYFWNHTGGHFSACFENSVTVLPHFMLILLTFITLCRRRTFTPFDGFFTLAGCPLLLRFSVAVLTWWLLLLRFFLLIWVEKQLTVVLLVQYSMEIGAWTIFSLFLGSLLHENRCPNMLWLEAPWLVIILAWSIQLFDEIKIDISNFMDILLLSLLLAVQLLRATGLLIAACLHLCWMRNIAHQPLGFESQLGGAEHSTVGWGEHSHGFLSRLTFWWTNPLMLAGCKRQLNSADALFMLPRKLGVSQFVNCLLPTPEIRFPEQDWKWLVSNLHSLFALEFYLLGVLRFIADAAAFCAPVLLGQLLQYLESDMGVGWKVPSALAGGLVGVTIVSALASLHFSYRVGWLGLKIRAALITGIAKKVTNVWCFDLSRFGLGQVVNLMSSDVDRVVNFIQSFHGLWSLPLQIAFAFYLLYVQVGLAFVAGIGFALLLIPFNRWLAGRICFYSTNMMKHKDARVKLISEMLLGIRVVKCSAWEPVFHQRISRLRQLELSALKGQKYLDALCVYLWAACPVIVAILTFTVYVLLGHQLTAAKVFTSVAVFNILITPLNAFPWVINGVVEAWVSVKRIQLFLGTPDRIPPSTTIQYGSLDSQLDSSLLDPSHALALQNATFSWDSDGGSALVLKDINLAIPRGKLVAIIGPVGSGKSSLLAGMIGELKTYQGTVKFASDYADEPVGFCPQEPWLQLGTLRDNILFGATYDPLWYQQVVYACALRDDFDVMPQGDLTLTGEQGVTLSGGQRSRIALARAVYQKCPLCLLDDPLSSLDAVVAEHIFTHCFQGLLKGQTVVWVTQQPQFYSKTHLIVRMQDGQIFLEQPEDYVSEKESVVTTESDMETYGSGRLSESGSDSDNITGDEPVLVMDEDKEIGTVKLVVYGWYMKAIGVFMSGVILFSLALMQGTKNGADWWLAHWITAHNDTSGRGKGGILGDGMAHHAVMMSTYRSPFHLFLHQEYTTEDEQSLLRASNQQEYYLIVYGCIAASNTLFALIRAFAYAYGGISAARYLHDHLLASILNAPIRFFDTTPLGRLMNRLSSDIYSVDDTLPFQANRLLAAIFSVVGTFTIISIGLPWFAVLILPIGTIYFCIQRYYRFASCDLKRLSSVTLSPLYTSFTEIIEGILTIRAFQVTHSYHEKLASCLTSNQRARYSVLAAGQWLGLRLQLIGILVVTCVALIAVIGHVMHYANPVLIGLSLSYALAMTGVLTDGVTSMTETEKELVSVERVAHYIQSIPKEGDQHTLTPHDGSRRKTSSSGSDVGVDQRLRSRPHLQFVNVNLRYAPDLPSALSDVSFTILQGERIGIMGRTGSGKSSLFQALFRCVDVESGAILVDNEDIRLRTLAELRSNLSLISQVPFLISGSLRENLDITGSHSDDAIFQAVHKAHLGDLVSRLGSVDGDVGDRGSRISAGERQLVCLARALLAQSKIVCMDEATGKMDVETEQAIQETIRESFKGVTMLVVAHRLQTVMELDRIFVMDKGRMVQEGDPRTLLQNGTLFKRFQSKIS